MNESRTNLETYQGSPLPLSDLSDYLSPKTLLGFGSPQGHTHTNTQTHKHTHTHTHTQEGKLLGQRQSQDSDPGSRSAL